jgi:hypothetical protein
MTVYLARETKSVFHYFRWSLLSILRLIIKKY